MKEHWPDRLDRISEKFADAWEGNVDSKNCALSAISSVFNKAATANRHGSKYSLSELVSYLEGYLGL